jgi:hypothetical protein
MATFTLTSLSAFDEPLNYHQTAATFLDYHAGEIVRRAQPLIDEMQQCHPDGAQAFSQAITALGQRLHDESVGHTQAVTYLTSHRDALATIEARLVGGTPPTFSPPSSGNALDLAQPITTAIKGVVHELRTRLGAVEHDLYEFDNKLRELENMLRGLQNHVPWELSWIPGIHGLIGDAAGAVDLFRKAYELLFVPAVDGEVAQPFIDYIKGLHEAYHTNVMQPFEPVTSTFVANYTPPANLAQYHTSLSEAPPDQQKTYAALDSIAGNLQSVVDVSEGISGFQLAMLALILVALGLIIATVAAAFLDAPVTAPALVADGAGTVASAAGVEAGSVTLGSLLSGFLSIEIPTWVWTVAAGTLTVGAILAIPSDTTVNMAKGGKKDTRDTGVMNDVWARLAAAGISAAGATHDDICRILGQMWDEAKGNAALRLKIKGTQKYYGCRQSSQK